MKPSYYYLLLNLKNVKGIIGANLALGTDQDFSNNIKSTNYNQKRNC